MDSTKMYEGDPPGAAKIKLPPPLFLFDMLKIIVLPTDDRLVVARDAPFEAFLSTWVKNTLSVGCSNIYLAAILAMIVVA